MKPIIDNGYMFNVKIYYSSGRHKYANLFELKQYELGIKLGTIKGCRRMNFIERFIFRNCR